MRTKIFFYLTLVNLLDQFCLQGNHTGVTFNESAAGSVVLLSTLNIIVQATGFFLVLIAFLHATCADLTPVFLPIWLFLQAITSYRLSC